MGSIRRKPGAQSTNAIILAIKPSQFLVQNRQEQAATDPFGQLLACNIESVHLDEGSSSANDAYYQEVQAIRGSF